jgi:hypothetical protein
VLVLLDGDLGHPVGFCATGSHVHRKKYGRALLDPRAGDQIRRPEPTLPEPDHEPIPRLGCIQGKAQHPDRRRSARERHAFHEVAVPTKGACQKRLAGRVIEPGGALLAAEEFQTGDGHGGLPRSSKFDPGA